MNLRTKLLALSLLTLLLPWSGWKLLQELERFLRDSQESALLASARTMAAALPMQYQTRLLFSPDLGLPLLPLDNPPALDGYDDDWPGGAQGPEFVSTGGGPDVRLLAGEYAGRLHLLFSVDDPHRMHAAPAGSASAGPADAIELVLRSPRGLFSFTISPEAPGPLQLHSERGDSGQLVGYWLEVEGGYRVELSLPAGARNTDFGFVVTDAHAGEVRRTGTLTDPEQPRWITPAARWDELSGWFASVEIGTARTWLVDTQAWVMADSGEADNGQQPTEKATWLQRSLYRLVAGERTEWLEGWPEDPVRLSDGLVQQALAGQESIGWSQDLESAVVWNTVAVPIRLENEVHGAIVMQSTSDGLLLVTNRALGRFLITTLALTLGLAAALWVFASRLSRRVRRLSTTVSQAMEDGVDPDALPLRDEGDELGELARNNARLLRAVAEYGQYLQTLAGKLSHELKTPLAITRSSLDNLSNQPLDGDSIRFLERALEGVDRQAAIVRAMSEASRLEAAIGRADWERVDLADFLSHCAEAYRSVHQGRTLRLELPDEKVTLNCAPDLLAQALDKLVDNAVSFSEPGDEVVLLLRRRPDRVELAVRNSGSRLPEELQDRLFDSLVSLREKRGAEPHLGLGLYIVRLVAEAHRGSARARNLDGMEGVEFVISIPC